MRRVNKYFIVFLFLLFLVKPGLTETNAASLSTLNFYTIEDNQDSLIFEVDVPWQSIETKQIVRDSHLFTEVSIANWMHTIDSGAPSLPFILKSIGVPIGADVSIQVITGHAHEIQLETPVVPAVTQKVKFGGFEPESEVPVSPITNWSYDPDPTYYEEFTPYPGGLAEISNIGMIRQQRVAGISLYPIQYQPQNNSIIIYEKLRVEIIFTGSGKSRDMGLSPDTSFFENFFEENLLNYESSRFWRVSDLSTLNAGIDETRDYVGSPTPWTVPEPAWRITVSDTGMYTLTYDELYAAGVLDSAPNPDFFQMYYQGSEIAIDVVTDNDDVFDPADMIIFYGEAIDSKYTNENVYWLTIGSTPGKRMPIDPSPPGTGEMVTEFVDQQTLEMGRYYLAGIPGNDDLDRFVWDFLNSSYTERSYSFTLLEPMPGTSSKLTLAMVGYTEFNEIDPDHKVNVKVNGEVVGETSWFGIAWEIFELDIRPDLIHPGENTISIFDEGLINNIVMIDYVKLEYSSSLIAEENDLLFDIPLVGPYQFRVEGFTEDTLKVYEIADPYNVVKLSEFLIEGSGPFAVQFEDELSSPSRFITLTQSAYKRITNITGDYPSNLQSTSHAVENIIISHRDFWEEAEILADYRNEKGMTTILVDVQDIYDEFGYGIKGVHPIHEFLYYAYDQWSSPKPAFVLLIGDGNYDPKDYLLFGRENFIPAYLAMADPWSGLPWVETAADNRFVTFGGEDLMPEMMIGRLSVNTPTEAQTMINKIIDYESNIVVGEWQSKLLAIADDPDAGGNFPIVSDNLIGDILPSNIETTRVYYEVTHFDITEAKNEIIDSINQGTSFVNYIGHGYYAGWTSLLTTTDVRALENGDMTPIVLSMTCNDGYFIYPNTEVKYDSMAEVFTRKVGGGAVASWSSTGNGLVTGHDYLNRGFLNAYYHVNVSTLGEATFQGKFVLWLSNSNLDLLDTYTLFGDPGMRFIHISLEEEIYLPIFLK